MKKHYYLSAVETSVNIADAFNKIIDAIPDTHIEQLSTAIITIQKALKTSLDTDSRDISSQIDLINQHVKHLEDELSSATWALDNVSSELQRLTR